MRQLSPVLQVGQTGPEKGRKVRGGQRRPCWCFTGPLPGRSDRRPQRIGCCCVVPTRPASAAEELLVHGIRVERVHHIIR